MSYPFPYFFLDLLLYLLKNLLKDKDLLLCTQICFSFVFRRRNFAGFSFRPYLLFFRLYGRIRGFPSGKTRTFAGSLKEKREFVPSRFSFCENARPRGLPFAKTRDSRFGPLQNARPLKQKNSAVRSVFFPVFSAKLVTDLSFRFSTIPDLVHNLIFLFKFTFLH